MLHLDFRSCVEEVMAAEMLSFGSSYIITRFYKEVVVAIRVVEVIIEVVVEIIVVVVVVIGEQIQ